MLLLIEGPDGAGKSTLVEALSRHLPNAAVTHHGPYKGASGRELATFLLLSMRFAFIGRSTILDRCWLSEPIYAEVYRRSTSRLSRPQVRMLERTALKLNGVVVICLPPFKVCEKAFLSGREELLETSEQLRRVYKMYAGNYIEELRTELPIVYYDYTIDSVEELLRDIDQEIARSIAHPKKVVLLGDRPNVRTHAQQEFHVPFVSFSGLGCSEWLAEQLDESGMGERDIAWFNAYSDLNEPLAVEALPPGVPVVALGRNASQWCLDHGVEHTRCAHPQAHKRFKAELEYPPIKILKEIKNATP